jgi:hypothetical protein
MSIKYLNPKSYGQVYQRLVNGYRKVKGKDPTGLDLIKIKLEAAEQIRNSEKIIKFPEEKITPFYEGRPSKGPQADVKKFPTKNKPAAQTYSSDFLDLLEEFNKISKNQPSLAEITGVSNKYPEKTGIVKSTIELLESKDPKSLSRELQRIMKREGTYVDYSDEEVAQILNGFESRTKNKIKPAEEMIDEGDFDPSGFAGGGLAYMLGEPVRMFKGGRIGYSVGAGNATGGRIGFAAGGIDKVRRAFLKLLGAGAGATAATKTGLFGLLKGKQEAKIATKAAEQVVKRNEPPAYVFDLVEIIRAKGKDITKSAQTIERETVKTYKGVDLYETPDGFRIRAEGKSAQEGGKEIDLMYSQMDEIKDEGLETQKSFTVTDYEEATVRPDAEGKMKDVDFYVDEADHKELKKIVDEEKNKFKSGGLAYMLGE